MRVFHSGSDSHAPFSHYLVTTDNGEEFIICAFCNHWVFRPMTASCNCKASCHALSRPENVTESLSEFFALNDITG